MKWEAHALVPAGVICKQASTDENNADEFSFCRILMMSRLRNIDAIKLVLIFVRNLLVFFNWDNYGNQLGTQGSRIV